MIQLKIRWGGPGDPSPLTNGRGVARSRVRRTCQNQCFSDVDFAASILVAKRKNVGGTTFAELAWPERLFGFESRHCFIGHVLETSVALLHRRSMIATRRALVTGWNNRV